jgi:hypothetical protein
MQNYINKLEMKAKFSSLTCKLMTSLAGMVKLKSSGLLLRKAVEPFIQEIVLVIL